jgi:MarR family transcriptional regulator, transcriptional regulator for hemolysin
MSKPKNQDRFDPVPACNITRDSRIGFLMRELTRLRLKLWTHKFEGLRMTREQWWTLGTLSLVGQDRGIIQTDLAKLLDVKKVAMGMMIDKLEARGLVERRPDPDDGRAWRIHLSLSGRAAIVEMIQAIDPLIPRMNEGISEEDLAVTERVLNQMRKNIQNLTIDL